MSAYGCFAAAANNRLGTLSGGAYPAACAACLPALLTSASAEFLLRVLVALRLASEIPRGTSRNQPLATNHCRKTKNPASSAGTATHTWVAPRDARLLSSLCS